MEDKDKGNIKPPIETPDRDIRGQAFKGRPKRGVGLRAFGSILFFLGILNIMFSLKAGVEIQGFYIFLIAAGAIFFTIGLWRNRAS